MRLDLNELQSGAWAEMYEAVPHKIVKGIVAISKKGDSATDEEMDELNKLTLGVMVSAWNVKDITGKEVKLPRDATQDELEMVDEFILQKLYKHVTEIVKKRAQLDPNSETAS